MGSQIDLQIQIQFFAEEQGEKKEKAEILSFTLLHYSSSVTDHSRAVGTVGSTALLGPNAGDSSVPQERGLSAKLPIPRQKRPDPRLTHGRGEDQEHPEGDHPRGACKWIA